MNKIFYFLPFLALTGCNYFSTPEEKGSKKDTPQQQVFHYKNTGNAESIIRPSIESRGYKLDWKAKGNYVISATDLKEIEGLSLGQALNKFQETFNLRNLYIQKKLNEERKDLKLGHLPYVLIFVCNDTVYVNEYSEQDYIRHNQKLSHEEVPECSSPEKVFIPKADAKVIENHNKFQNKAPVVVPSTQGQDNKQAEYISATPPANIEYPKEIQNSNEAIDIHEIDFGYIAITPEFIQELEKDTGQKFDMNKYIERQKAKQQNNQR